MKTFHATDDVFIEILDVDKGDRPIVRIMVWGWDTVTIFAHEIRPLIAALTEAAVWLADEATGEEPGDFFPHDLQPE